MKLNKEMENNTVKLKISNGHQIWILKNTINGYRYLGIYSKPIKLKMEESKWKKKNKKA